METFNLRLIKQAMVSMTRQCWEAGIAAQAMLECGDREFLPVMVYDMVLRQSADGRLCNVENTPAVTDSAFCIPAVLLTGRKLHNEKFIVAAEKNVEYLRHTAERTNDGILYHMQGTGEIWADSAAFLPLSLALAGDFHEGYHQMMGIINKLYAREKGLYYHIWDEKSKTYIHPVIWGVGNGWILTGLMRLIRYCPEECIAELKRLKELFHKLLNQILSYENRNHGFHDILDNPNTFEESETAAMTAYTIYRGIYEGIVPGDYYERAEKIRQRISTNITSDGLILYASSSPNFDKPGTSVECQAHVIMMETYRNILRDIS